MCRVIENKRIKIKTKEHDDRIQWQTMSSDLLDPCVDGESKNGKAKHGNMVKFVKKENNDTRKFLFGYYK